MPIPRVFVSSTCYDLHYIRDSLGLFIKNMGFDPVLSEKGNVYYDPSMHVQDSLLAEVANCQLFVLVIGGRFGNKFKNKPESIVNHEYRKAIEEKIPVFAVVEAPVYSEYRLYLRNKENSEVNSKIIYSEVDSSKIFEFMHEVSGNSFNNALVPFSNVNELESYLRQQWAGLMFDLLSKKTTYEREAEIFETLSHVEFLAKQILNSFGQDVDKISTILYEILSKSELGKIEKNMRVKFSIANVIESSSVLELFDKTRITVNKHAEDIELVPTEKGFSATVPASFFNNLEPDYKKTRKEVLNTLEYYGWSIDSFLNRIKPSKIAKKNSGLMSNT
jgi:hypothetical protein